MNKQKIEKTRSRRRRTAIFMLFGLMLGFLVPMLHTTSIYAIPTAGEIDKDNKKTDAKSSSDSGSSSSSSGSSDSSSGSSSSSSSGDNTDYFAEGAKKQVSATSDSKYAGNIFARLGGSTPFSSNQSVWQYGTSYDALYKVGGAYKDAAAFAFQMQQTGLDDNAQATNNGGVTSISDHPVLGSIMLAGYQANEIIGKIFSFVGDVMQSLNVFAWLQGVASSGPFSQTPFGAELHQIYTTVRDLGLVVAALICCAGVGAAIFGADLQHSIASKIGNTFWKFFLKYIVAFCMFAALATGYGVLATNVKHMCDDVTSANPVGYLLSSHMVDFQDWAYRTRLSLSSGGNPSLNGLLPNTAKANASKYKTPLITPGTINAINANLAGLNVSGAVQSNSGFDSGFTSADGSYMSPLMGEKQHQQEAHTANADTLWLLNQWRTGQGCTASGYASYAMSNLTGLPAAKKGTSRAKALQTAIKKFGQALAETPSDDSSDAKSGGKDGDGYKDCGITSSGDMPVSNGTLQASGNYFTTQSLKGSSEVPSNRSGGGLSTLGMYVYLSSTFDKSEMDYYDLSKGSNANVSAIHASVVIPNHGLVYWGSIIQLTILPFVMLVFGVICAWAMLTDILMVLPKVFIESFATGFGAESGALKAIGAIMQIAVVSIGSLAFYGIGMDLLKLLLSSGTSMASALNAMPVLGHAANSGVVAGAMNATSYALFEIVTTFLVGFVAYKIVKERRKFLDALVGMIGDGMKRIVHAVYGFGLGGRNNPAGVSNTYAQNNESNNENDGDGDKGTNGLNPSGRLGGGNRHGGSNGHHGGAAGHGGKGTPGASKEGAKGANSREAAMGDGKDAANSVNDNSKNVAEKGNEGKNGDADSEVTGSDMNGTDDALPETTDNAATSPADLDDPANMDDDADQAADGMAAAALGEEMLQNGDEYNAMTENEDAGAFEDQSQAINNDGDLNADEQFNQGDQIAEDAGDQAQDIQYDEEGNPLNVDDGLSTAEDIDGSTQNIDNGVTTLDQADNSTMSDSGDQQIDADNHVDGDSNLSADRTGISNVANAQNQMAQFATSADSAAAQEKAIAAQEQSAGKALADNGYTSMRDAASQVQGAMNRASAADSAAHSITADNTSTHAQQLAANNMQQSAHSALQQQRQNATSAWAHQSMEANGMQTLMGDRVASQTVSSGQAYKALQNVASSRSAVQSIQRDVRQSGVPISQQPKAMQQKLFNAATQYQKATTTASQMGLRNSVISNSQETSAALSSMQQNLGSILHGNTPQSLQSSTSHD